MKQLIIVAESGSDITRETALEQGIHLVPMHVTMGQESYDDGFFATDKIYEYYDETGDLPKTSGCTPEDFIKAFDEIHGKYPDAHILYLAYSAVTTCSYQSAVLAARDRDYITLMDTGHVSAGQGAIVLAMAEVLRKHPEISIEEAVEKASDLIKRARMCFVPDNLEYLRAGGRVSNVAFLGSRILNIHPCIEILDGKLVATRKYRGKMSKVAVSLLKDYAEAYGLKKDYLRLVYTKGLSEEVMECVKIAAAECGFQKLEWAPAGGVITTHAGPGAFGIAGFTVE